MVFFDNSGRDRKAQASPSLVSSGCEKGVCNIVEQFGWNADPLIPYAHGNFLAVGGYESAEEYTFVLSAEGLTGILNEVNDHLFNTLERTPDTGKIGSQVNI